MNNFNKDESSNTLNNNLDFYGVELNPGWDRRDEFFDGFSRHAPLFSYQINYNGDFYADNFTGPGEHNFTGEPETAGSRSRCFEHIIKRGILVFDSPHDFLNIGRAELLAIAKNFNFIAAGSRTRFSAFGPAALIAAHESILKASAEAGIAKIRMYIPAGDEKSDSYSFDEISKFIQHLTGRNLLDKNKLSLCFQTPGITDNIELNVRLALKYPALIDLLHLQTANESNRIETALFFYLKYNSPALKKCTIAPFFSRHETAGTKEGAPADASDSSGSRFLDTLEILRSLEFSNIPGVFFISCPTCSRCKIDLIGCAKSVYGRVKYIETPLKIAVMGCEVNGPGEASHADIGAAGSIKQAVVFERGKIVERVAADDLEEKLMERINSHVK
jgi:hypothetical protein